MILILYLELKNEYLRQLIDRYSLIDILNLKNESKKIQSKLLGLVLKSHYFDKKIQKEQKIKQVATKNQITYNRNLQYAWKQKLRMKVLFYLASFVLIVKMNILLDKEEFNFQRKPHIRSSIIQNLQADPNFIMFAKGKFKQWMKKHLKDYNPEEYMTRFYIFESNLQIVLKHNAQSSMFQMETNSFADLSDDEFKQIYLMKEYLHMQKKMTAPSLAKLKKNGRKMLLQAIDYRQHVKMAPIKAQRGCAACYAFACLGSIQLHYALKRQAKTPTLSEQYLIDCCKVSGFNCNGCISGSLGSSLDFIAKEGIPTIKSYPYVASLRQCKTDVKKYNLLNKKLPYYQINGVDNTRNYLVEKGPLTVAVDSTNWKLYKKGIFNKCSPDPSYTHAVTLIGVEDSGVWIIRNSWGSQWGDQGYIRLQEGNSCGITDYVFLPNIV